MMRCVVCKTGVVTDHRHAVCDACGAARDHVVSMTRAAITGDSIATCLGCDWSNVERWSYAGRSVQDEAVLDHWRAVVEGAQ